MFDRLIDLVVQFLHLFQFWFVTSDWQKSLVLRLGRLHRHAGPGFHWKWPLHIEVVLSASVVLETITVGPQSLTTKDDQSIVMSTVVTFRIADVQKFLLDVEGAHQVIEDSTYGINSTFIMDRTWPVLRAMDVGHELTKLIRRQAKRYGVEIENVQIADFTKSKSFRLVQSMNHHSHS